MVFHGRASLEERKAPFVKFEKHLRCGMNRARRRKGRHHHCLTNRLSREIVFSQKFRDQRLNTFPKHFSSQRGQLTFAISFINRNLISNILLLSNRKQPPVGLQYLCSWGLMKLQGWGNTKLNSQVLERSLHRWHPHPGFYCHRPNPQGFQPLKGD